jgi:hypothetical protein
MKKGLVFIFAILANFLGGGLLASAVGISPLIGGAAMSAIAFASPVFGLNGTTRAGIYTEVWTGEMIKAFRNSVESIGWLNAIRDYSQYAENDVIHFVNLGGDPTVLINNTTYPLQIESLADSDKPIGLDKYQTNPTRITDDELNAISFDKMGSVITRHREAMDQKKYSKAISALAPSGNTDSTPVLLTSGAVDPDGTRKMVTKADIIKLKKSFDKLKVPNTGRILVLCSDHVADLLNTDQKFAEQYYNYTTGKIANLYGFQVYEYQDNPYYTVATKAKLAYGTEPGEGATQASVAFFAPRMFKATGSTKSYLSEAKSNPETQENLVNFRHYFIALPLKNEAIGAIVSDLAEQAPEITITTADSIEFAKTAGTKTRTVAVTGGLEWTVAKDSEEDSWLTVTKTGDKVTVAVTANNGEAAPERTGTFTIAVSGSDVTKQVTVTQAANA